MKVSGIDERRLRRERTGGNFLVFIYEGGDEHGAPWSVDSYLLTEADLACAFGWLGKHLPENCCWALGVVEQPERPTAATDVTVTWVVGSDVLNSDPSKRDTETQRSAEEMLARRHRLTLS